MYTKSALFMFNLKVACMNSLVSPRVSLNRHMITENWIRTCK
jgi:hypothetical protein